MDKSNGIALAYLTALVSGISVFANSFGVVTMDATAYTLVKNVAVAAIIAAIALSIGAWREIFALNRKQVLMLLFVGVIGGGVAFALYFNGLAATGGAAGSFLYRLLFVFAVVIAVGALKEKFEWRIGAGALAVLAGNLVLLATIFWAAEYAVSKKALEGLSATTVVAARMGIGAIVLLGILAWQGKIGALGAIPAASFGWIALAVGLLTLFTTLWYSALKRTTLISATAALALGGPVSALLAAAFAGKALAPVSLLGFFLIAAGAVFVVGAAETASAAYWLREKSRALFRI